MITVRKQYNINVFIVSRGAVRDHGPGMVIIKMFITRGSETTSFRDHLLSRLHEREVDILYLYDLR